MGGIKHNMWGMGPGYQGQDLGKIKDWMERSGQRQEWYVKNNVVLCKICGGQIHTTEVDEFQKQVDFETELQEEVHGRCKREYMKQQLEEAKRLKEEYENMEAEGVISKEPEPAKEVDPNINPETGLRWGFEPPEGW